MRTVDFDAVQSLPEVDMTFTKEHADKLIAWTIKEEKEMGGDLTRFNEDGMDIQIATIQSRIGLTFRQACWELCGDSCWYWEYMQHMINACFPGLYNMVY